MTDGRPDSWSITDLLTQAHFTGKKKNLDTCVMLLAYSNVSYILISRTKAWKTPPTVFALLTARLNFRPSHARHEAYAR